MQREIHLEERPTTFKQVVGQEDAARQLIGMAKGGGIPHCLLFTGPSGCGKTTLARIVRKKLRCGDRDFYEVNAAENRGIDMVRQVQVRVGLAPIDGEARVWLIDECHQLTADAQGAFLKLLEEPPDHVYFMLATTDPQKLRKTIRTRCTEIKVRDLTQGEITGLAVRVAADRGVQLDDEVADRLGEVAAGSARKGLVLLQQIISIGDPKQQIAALNRADAQIVGFQIAQALMQGKSWHTLAKLIRECDDEPETIRRIVLGYFTKVALGGGQNALRATNIIEEFQDNYYDTGKAGLVLSCFRVASV